MTLYTFQDFEEAKDKMAFIQNAIDRHISSEMFKVAMEADLYDRQKNKTINEYVRMLLMANGQSVKDYTIANNKIASNFFHRLNTQRCTYSLGNGMTFNNKQEIPVEGGGTKTVDLTKQKLGDKFDGDIYNAAYKALIHGVSFVFWNLDRVYIFPLTEFVPLWDEYDGTLKAGIRFWRLAPDKPMSVVLYEIDGYTKYRSMDNEGLNLYEYEPKKAYVTFYAKTNADHSPEVIGEENYSSLPIIPMWGSKLKQSTLIGMKQSIDSYDLIRSGFANDLTDCSQIYWIVKNAGGMDDAELEQFRDRLKLLHIASVDADSGAGVEPYTQDIPFQARSQYLSMIRNGLYEDFGGLDVHTVAAGATNDHIDAAYQPMDENADDFEFCVIECVQQILALMDIEDTPIFKRNRISNQKEQTEMVLSAADYLDEETIINKLPFITPDEVSAILARKDAENMERMPIQVEQVEEEEENNNENEEIGGIE